MRIKIDHIPEAGLDLAFSRQADHFPVIRQMAGDGQAGFPRPVDVQVHVRRIGRIIEAEAQMHTVVELVCSRCLAAFSRTIEARFFLTYAPRPETGSPAADGDGQADLLSFQGKEVDLTEGVQEQLVLALPIQPLCDPACKGLCPGCGADRNHQPCTCPPVGSSSPFAALENIELKKTK